MNKAPHNAKPKTVDEFFDAYPGLWEHENLNYRHRLPSDLDAAILDIGSGPGHFLAACAKWGYRNLSVMDYVLESDQFRVWGVDGLYLVTDDLPSALSGLQGCFDFIHAAHLIEHVPKHDLLENVDAMFYALRPGGTIALETPNMLAPSAMASLFVTLGHEYGFTQHNLCSLLNICGFRSERADPVLQPAGRAKARIGDLLRKSVLASTYLLKCRLFGFGDAITAQNIIVTGVRPEADPFPERVIPTCSSSTVSA